MSSEKFKAVDRYKILSIAHRKVRDMKMTSQGYISKPLMWPEVPQTEEEIEKLRLTVYGSSMAYPGLVSLDSKSALIMVDFFEDKIDYATCFKEFKTLRKKMEDEIIPLQLRVSLCIWAILTAMSEMSSRF